MDLLRIMKYIKYFLLGLLPFLCLLSCSDKDENVNKTDPVVEETPKISIEEELELAETSFEKGDIASALESYMKVIKDFPDNEIADSKIRFVLMQTPRMLHKKLTTSTVPDLLNVLGEMIKVKPDMGEAYYALGMIYGRELGNMEASILCFDKAETCKFEKTATYYDDMGVAYGLSGDFEKSIIALEKAIEAYNDILSRSDLTDKQKEENTEKLANTYSNLGSTYINLGNEAKGKEYIDKGKSVKQKAKK